MTLSRDARLQNIAHALALMEARVREGALDHSDFNAAEPPFHSLFSTTWRELVERGFIERFELVGAEVYTLTGRGWLAALEVTGRIEEPELNANSSKLAASLKAIVKGRAADAVVDTDELAAKSLPPPPNTRPPCHSQAGTRPSHLR